MQIDPLPQMRDVLRSFVGDSANIVMKDQHSGGVVPIGRDFLHVDHSAVGDAANLVQPVAALTFNFNRSFLFAAKHEISGQHGPESARKKCVETKRKHNLSEVAQERSPALNQSIRRKS